MKLVKHRYFMCMQISQFFITNKILLLDDLSLIFPWFYLKELLLLSYF